MRNKNLWRGQRLGRLPVEQCANAIETTFGGGTQPAEVAHALQSTRQNVLQEAMKELLGGKRQRSLFSGAVFVGEGVSWYGNSVEVLRMKRV